ncbi:hypothetical protein RJT34_15239 [Clitoria ternatea]|uniref:Transmembrane protein n=1 Tax=Clitoria ternatea TaxID=43366 RepID=A0AAN9PNN7_CLITE
MCESKDPALRCRVFPIKILCDTLRVISTNKLLFSSILCFTTLPLSYLSFTLTISTHTLRLRIYHLEALARVVSTRMEARHVWHESRDDAVSLLHTKALFSLLYFPLSLAAAVSSVHVTVSAVQGKPPAVCSALRHNWKRPAVTSVFVYVILLAFAPVPRVLSAPFVTAWVRVLVRVLGSGAEVYLMAVMSLALVVSVAEDRVGLDAIWAGSWLMKERRVCAWILSGFLVLVSWLMNWKVGVLMESENWVIGVFVCLYALVVPFSYVITTVFYCESRRLIEIKEQQSRDNQDCVSLSLSL